jgi:hypothetical protein
MLNAEQSLALLWRRLVAALSLIAAAALAPTVPVSVGGAAARALSAREPATGPPSPAPRTL